MKIQRRVHQQKMKQHLKVEEIWIVCKKYIFSRKFLTLFNLANFTGFVEHPRISKLVRDPSSCSFIEEFLLDIQAIEQSHAFILWMNIMKFKNILVR